MDDSHKLESKTIVNDLISGVVVFLVALPLCLGVALASNAPLFSGLLAGIVGGIIVGSLSKSHTSVSGPAAGLTAVVAFQIDKLGSFESFLVAVMLAGVIQIILGIIKAGFLSAFVPSSVIKGLLAAIGIILILKQIPHLLGHDTDYEGEMSFWQPDQENTFSEFGKLLGDIHPGATVIGLVSIAVILLWGRIKMLKKSIIPAPLVVVLLGVALGYLMDSLGGRWVIEESHLVQVPVASSAQAFFDQLTFPDFSTIGRYELYIAAITIALVASLETLLNLEAVDKLDPHQRNSPPSRELLAQGVGNVVGGLIGAIPVTSVIIRSSVNIDTGNKTKKSAIFHGFLILGSVALLPTWLNQIPLSCLAAILIVTGYKLANPALIRKMWEAGKSQFAPFIVTVTAIVFSDLLIGTIIGLMVAISFILYSNLKRPIRRVVEKHPGNEVLRIELANQVSFLNRAALLQALQEVPDGQHVLLDARNTDYIDPDVLDLIMDFKEKAAPARKLTLSLLGFKQAYLLDDEIQYVDFSSRDLQDQITPDQALQLLLEGNERFRTGKTLTRDLSRQMTATATGQFPLAIILSCIDSRTPAEIIFDLGLGDIFSVRIAGNVISPKVLGSMEYGCAVAGSKLLMVVGHTRCGAVTATLNSHIAGETLSGNVQSIASEIAKAIDEDEIKNFSTATELEQNQMIDQLACKNVCATIKDIKKESPTLNKLVEDGRVKIVGAIYDVRSGKLDLLETD